MASRELEILCGWLTGGAVARRGTLTELLFHPFFNSSSAFAQRSLRDKLPQLNRMRILEWTAGALILGWGGIAYSILRISAFVPPQPPRMRHRFGGNCEMETCS